MKKLVNVVVEVLVALAALWLVMTVGLASWLSLDVATAVVSAGMLTVRVGLPVILGISLLGTLAPQFEDLLDKGVQAEDRALRRMHRRAGGSR